jgi:hypothetical protein
MDTGTGCLPDCDHRFRVIVEYPDGQRVVVEERVSYARARKVKLAIDREFPNVFVEELPSVGR